MINYNYNEKSTKYITVSIEELLMFMSKMDMEIEGKVKVFELCSQYIELQKKNKIKSEQKINILAESELGQLIIKSNLSKKEDNPITYHNIVSAYNIAVFTDNSKMANKLLPLFRQDIYGSKEELLKVINPTIIEYIEEHNNFYEFLENESISKKAKAR